MAKKLDASDPVVIGIFIAMNSLLWLAICYRMIMRWHFIAGGLHLWFIGLILVVPLLWQSLLKDKPSISSMMGLTLMFMSVAMLTRHLI